MLTATFLAIFMIPMFFVVISKFSKKKDTPSPGATANIEGPAHDHGDDAVTEGH